MPEFGAITVSAHASTHQNGGDDELNLAGLNGDLADAQDAKAHVSTHQNGGSDEISLTGLDGVLADKQDSDKLQGRDLVATAPSDGQVVMWDDGNSQWEPATPGGYTVVHDEALTAGALYIDITGLDVNAHGFYDLFIILEGDAGDSLNVNLYINGDTTTTNYYNQYLRASGSVRTSARGNAATIMGCSAGESAFGRFDITRDPSSRARASGEYQPNSGTSMDVFVRNWIFDGTVANITSIRVASANAVEMGIGTRVILLKPPL